MDDETQKAAAAIAESLGYIPIDQMDERARSRFVKAAEAALTHFAPPRQRMMIEGMAVEEIVDEINIARDGQLMSYDSLAFLMAKTAHRLATTPAPEVDLDADAGAKAAFQRYQDAKPNGWLRERWHELNEDGKNCWRAVAAMEKGNG